MKDYKKYPLGANPSPDDPRDYPISLLTPVLNVFPEEYRLTFDGVIKNQGLIGACVGESLSYTRDIKETEQNKRNMLFSPGFIYGFRLPGQHTGTGMYPREALSNLKNYGAVLQKDFPYLEEMPSIQYKVEDNKAELLDLAKPYRISAYTRVYLPDEIKTALIHKDLGPVTIMCPIYESFYLISKQTPIVPIPNQANERLHGHHEMTIIGWRRDNTWIVLNSWGDDWGDEGKCYMPFEFPIQEAWSITDTILPQQKEYWRVQIGAYGEKANAYRTLYELEAKNIPAYVVHYEEYYRVQTGAFANKENAIQWQKDLEAKGYKSILKYY